MRTYVVLMTFVACAAPKPSERPIEATIAPVADGKSAAPAPPSDAPRSARFPGGPGVTLVSDQLSMLIDDGTIFALRVPHEERVAAVRWALGVQGETRKEGENDALSFVAVGPKSLAGPWSCWELVLVANGSPRWALWPAALPRCGLPYAEDHAKAYIGRGATRTVGKLRQVQATLGFGVGASAQAQAIAKLGPPDVEENADALWFGVGPRDASAPISCLVLRIGAKTEITPAALGACGLSWGPPPAARFDPGPVVPPIDKPAALATCARTCGAMEMCVIEQRLRTGATIRTDPDGPRAHYPDGYPALTELLPSCTPIPPACAARDSSCFFGTPPATRNGPCPSTGVGHSFQSLPGPHILCFTRAGVP